MNTPDLPATRRAVVRGALWSAPAVVMVTAAPAMALTTTTVSYSNTLMGPTTSGRVTTDVGTFKNTSTQSMTITMTWTVTGNTIIGASAPSGWSVSYTGTVATFTITLAPGATSPSGSFTMQVKNAGQGTVTGAFHDSVSNTSTALFSNHHL